MSTCGHTEGVHSRTEGTLTQANAAGCGVAGFKLKLSLTGILQYWMSPLEVALLNPISRLLPPSLSAMRRRSATVDVSEVSKLSVVTSDGLNLASPELKYAQLCKRM